MKTVTRKLSECKIQLYSKTGKGIAFSNPNPNLKSYPIQERKSYMWELWTEGINVLSIRNFKISEFNYSKKEEVTVEITYDDELDYGPFDHDKKGLVKWKHYIDNVN